MEALTKLRKEKAAAIEKAQKKLDARLADLARLRTANPIRQLCYAFVQVLILGGASAGATYFFLP